MLGWLILILSVLFIYIYNGVVIKRHRAEDSLALYGALGKKRAELLLEFLELPGIAEMLPDAEEIRQAADSRNNAGSWPEKVTCDERISALWQAVSAHLPTSQQVKELPRGKVTLAELKELAQKVPAAFRAYNDAAAALNKVIDSPLGELLKKVMQLQKYPILQAE